MTPDQIDLLISAARKTLCSTHGLFDYLPMITPVLAAALGWLAAYLQFKFSFRKGLEKEHYYASKQNVLEILKLQADFTEYIYEFYKAVKNSFSCARPIPNDFLTDFITNYDSRIARIHLLRRIEFPESTFDDKPILELLRKLESHISSLNIKMTAAFQSRKADVQIQPPIPREDADRFSNESTDLINELCQEIAIQENIMVKILSNEAKRLGLRTIMPTVHREKLKPKKTEGQA